MSLRGPLSLRARVSLAAALTLLVSMGTVIAIGNALLARGLEQDETVVLVARAAALAASIEESGGRIVVDARPSDPRLSGRAWVYAEGREISAPVNGGVGGALAAGLADATRPTEVEDESAQLRLRAIPVMQAGSRRQIATVVVSVSTRPYEFTRTRTLLGSIVLGVLVVLIGSWIAWRAVGAALRPVATMARDAEDWSEHDLDRRFDRGPARDELGSLASTLDGLLGRIAASRRHEQRFSAEMAHELRTPLAAMRGEAELLQRRAGDPEAVRAGLTDVLRLADRMASVIDTLLGVAREESAPGVAGTGDAERCVRAVAEAVAAAAHARGVAVRTRVEPGLPPVAAPDDLVERALQPIVDNAVRHAASVVELAVQRDGDALRFLVTDDGPGVDPALVGSVFEPGVRSAGSGGVGLGLALARRLAIGAEGDVQMEQAPGGGARFVLHLPAFR